MSNLKKKRGFIESLANASTMVMQNSYLTLTFLPLF